MTEMKRKMKEILGAAAPTTGPLALTTQKPDMARLVMPGLAGAVAGYMLWKRHPVLGALNGYAVGSSVLPFKDGHTKEAMGTVAVSAAATMVALKWRKHPAVAYVGTSLGAGMLASSLGWLPKA